MVKDQCRKGVAVVCEQYQFSIMALLDGEVTEAEKLEIEDHLHECISCYTEYTNQRDIHELTTSAVTAGLPGDYSWDNYYRDVCRKMEHGASWAAWSGVALLLVLAGCLMIFGFRGSGLAILVGSIAFAVGAGLVFVSYFCNCSK